MAVLPYLCLWRCNSCVAKASLFDYSSAILEWLKNLFIDYSGAKCAYFVLKTTAAPKSLFRVVENNGFADRLRNDHLEKSAVTGACCPRRSPVTAEKLSKVHLRLRFQNLGKPRTAGLCGWTAGACDCGPLSRAFIERLSLFKNSA